MNMNPDQILEQIPEGDVLEMLRQKLSQLKSELGSANHQEDSADADEEDKAERDETGNEQAALKETLQQEIDLINLRIKWIEINHDKCAAPGCVNKVEAGRRKNGGVTCPEHIEMEESLLVLWGATT